MNQDTDLEIYRHISNEMEVAEIYLGHIPFDFHYTKALYSARCTEAIPFNPFDKVICELLKVEEYLNFKQIGDILGMNVYESENPKRYLDIAEKEILIEALQSLRSIEFGKMIEGGDLDFSACRLTQTGREYAEQKSKYKITENKPFTIFFDQTTRDHLHAKLNFEFKAGMPSEREFEIEFVDEIELKEIAAVQIPDIYNTAKQYSFTDAILKQQKNLYFEFLIAITFNSKLSSYLFYCYDTVSKSIHANFTNWINSNENVMQDILAKYSDSQSENTSVSIDFLTVYANQISEFNSDTKLISLKSSLIRMQFIDEYLFLAFFSELVNPTAKVELIFCLPTLSKSIYSSISNIVQKAENDDSRFFFVFPDILSEDLSISINQLRDIADEVMNLYIIQLEIESFILLCKTEAESFYFEEVAGLVNNFQKTIFNRKAWDKKADELELHFLEKFADEHALDLCEEVNTVINKDFEETVSREQLDEMSFYEFKLQPFVGIGRQAETVELALNLIGNFKDELIESLEEKLNSQLDDIEFAIENLEDEKDLERILNSLSSVASEIIFDDSEIFRRNEKLKSLVAIKKEIFAEARKAYSFIIDTNIFIEAPDIIQKIQSNNKIVIAAKVLDELDRFKVNPLYKEIVSRVIRDIFADKNKNIHRAKANLKLLPPDFSKKSPDNMILATALMYKDKHGILVTNDMGLHVKAKTVDMKVMSYNDFIAKFVKPNNI